MTARDARKISDYSENKNLNFFATLQLSNIESKIRKAAKKGRRECYFFYGIRPNVEKILKEKGFSVIVSQTGAGSKVYW